VRPSWPVRARTLRSENGTRTTWPRPSATGSSSCSAPLRRERTVAATGRPYIIRRTMTGRYLFTSESVTEGHPDKLADQISDAVLDSILADDPEGRVACETFVTTGVVIVAGEITTRTYVDVPKVVRDTVTGIGYTDAKSGIDGDTCGVMVAIQEQSSDIAQGVD